MPQHFTIKQDAYAAIEAKFHCQHPERQLRLRVLADGRRAYYRQCLTCGVARQAQSTKDATRELGASGNPAIGAVADGLTGSAIGDGNDRVVAAAVG